MILSMGLAFETHRGTDELLERDEQLAMLSEALNEARLGQGRIVLIGGEAGAGKTTLVRAFCRRLDRDIRVLVGACDALSTPRPLGPLLDVARECEALAAALEVAAPPTDVFAILHDELAEQPTVLVLEDLHWGDEATFDVLRLLARRIDVPALVVATYRDDGLHRDHPLRVLAGDLATAAAVDRLALSPLSPDAVAQLAVGHAIDPDDLYARTGGNPFFVAQVLAAGGTGVPATVRDAVLARAASLPDRRSRCSRPSRSPCPAPSPGCSRPLPANASRTWTSASRRDSSSATETPSPSGTSSPVRRSRTRWRRHAESPCNGASSQRPGTPQTVSSTRRGLHTTPKRRAMSMPCSSSPLLPLLAPRPPARTGRRPRSTHAPSG